MQNAPVPRWLHTAMLVAALALFLCGITAWSFAYRVQSATLFSFAVLLAYQWYALRSRRTATPPAAK